MAEINRIKSFKTFSEVRANEAAAKLAEENATKRSELTAKIAAILDEMDITSFDGLEEDVRKELIAKAFGEVSEEAEEAEEDLPEVSKEEEEVNEKDDAGTHLDKLAELVKGSKSFMTVGKELKSAKYDYDFSTGMMPMYTINADGFKFAIINKKYVDKGDREVRDIAIGLMESSQATEVETNTLFEATVEIDAMNPEDKDFLKFLKKNKVKLTNVEMDGPGGGNPVVTMQGKRKDLEKVLADCDYGWCDGDLAEYIEEALITEAVIPTAKREAKKVLKYYTDFFNRYSALKGLTKKQHLGAVKRLFVEAMIDANFSREAGPCGNKIKGSLSAIEVKVADLNGANVKVPTSRITQIIDDNAPGISGAAKWAGIGIVEGTALYLESLKEPAMAEALVACFNATFEGVTVILTDEEINERNAFLAARAKAIEEGAEEFEFNGKKYPVILNESQLNEGEREEQWAMEIYTNAVGSKGDYSEDELAKAGKDTFEEIVNAAGYKGSRGKKITDELMRIATESVVTESEVKSDEEFDEYAKTVLQKAFGEDYDEAKAKEVIDGILSKVDGDYGAAVGMLTSSLGESVVTEAKYDKKKLLKAIENSDDAMILVKGKEYIIYNPNNGNDDNAAMWGDKTIVALDSDGEEFEFKYSDIERFSESVEVTEKKADGTISDDEDERRESLMAEVESAMDQLLAKIKADADDIGGSFRSPGIMYDAKKIMDTKLKRFK